MCIQTQAIQTYANTLYTKFRQPHFGGKSFQFSQTLLQTCLYVAIKFWHCCCNPGDCWTFITRIYELEGGEKTGSALQGDLRHHRACQRLCNLRLEVASSCALPEDITATRPQKTHTCTSVLQCPGFKGSFLPSLGKPLFYLGINAWMFNKNLQNAERPRGCNTVTLAGCYPEDLERAQCTKPFC